jgi:CubicO group peptidase (beta-lactamase class C family)
MDETSFLAVVSEMERNPGLRMKNLIISSPTGIYIHEFNSFEGLTDLRSISKLAVALTIGVAISSGTKLGGAELSLDMKIWPFFEEYSSLLEAESRRNLSNVRLRHLLNNTMGHRSGFLFRKDIQGRDPGSLLEYIFSQPIEFEPGSHFSYSNVGWYLASVIVKNELGVSLSDWVSELLLAHLGISEFTWKQYGEYEAGATGLEMLGRDAHKLGSLLLADGKWDNVQVVPQAWVETIRGKVVKASSGYDAASPLQATAYGYGIWSCDDGTYYCDGSGGQFVIVVPAKRLVISALAEEGDTLTVSRCLTSILHG